MNSSRTNVRILGTKPTELTRSAGVRVALGHRWTPQHVIRIDTLAGFYEEINSPVYARAEREVQRALLPQKPSARTVPCPAAIPTRPSFWRRFVRRLFQL